MRISANGGATCTCTCTYYITENWSNWLNWLTQTLAQMPATHSAEGGARVAGVTVCLPPLTLLGAEHLQEHTPHARKDGEVERRGGRGH